jgi:hypothetical protein
MIRVQVLYFWSEAKIEFSASTSKSSEKLRSAFQWKSPSNCPHIVAAYQGIIKRKADDLSGLIRPLMAPNPALIDDDVGNGSAIACRTNTCAKIGHRMHTVSIPCGDSQIPH